MLTLLCEQEFINLGLKSRHQKFFRGVIHSQTKILECLFYSIEKAFILSLYLNSMGIMLENKKVYVFNKAKFEPSHVIISPHFFLFFFSLSQCDMTQTKIAG